MATEMAVEDVPEVMEFLDAKAELESFCAQNSRVMQQYAALCEQYNTTREAADQKVRQLNVECGPFEQLTPQVKIHAEQLFNSIGRAEFIKAGGVVGTKSTYDMDKKTFEAALARGAIPPELEAVVKETIPKYKVIPKAVLP
jgi:hypothetical protein